MRAPGVAAAAGRDLQAVEDRAKQPVEIGEGLHPVRATEAVVERSSQHPVSQEIDEGVCFGVDIVLVEQHFREVHDLLQAPGERLDVGDQIGVGAQRIEIDPVRLEGRVEAHPLERRRRHTQPLVALPIFVAQITGLVEEAEIGPLDVEAQRGDAALVGREVREDRAQQEFDRARLGREAGHTGDVQVRGFGTEQEIGVEVNRRLMTRRCIEADRNRGRRC